LTPERTNHDRAARRVTPSLLIHHQHSPAQKMDHARSAQRQLGSRRLSMSRMHSGDLASARQRQPDQSDVPCPECTGATWMAPADVSKVAWIPQPPCHDIRRQKNRAPREDRECMAEVHRGNSSRAATQPHHWQHRRRRVRSVGTTCEGMRLRMPPDNWKSDILRSSNSRLIHTVCLNTKNRVAQCQPETCHFSRDCVFVSRFRIRA